MTAICTAMKAEKIKIYTIIFGGAPNATTQALYQDCATIPSMYYYAPNNDALADAFTRHRRPARQPADHRVTRDGARSATSSAATAAPPRSSSR